MKTLRLLPWLLAALGCAVGCTQTSPPPATDDVQAIPRAGVGTFGGPGAFGGGGQKPTTPTAPFPSS